MGMMMIVQNLINPNKIQCIEASVTKLMNHWELNNIFVYFLDEYKFSSSISKLP